MAVFSSAIRESTTFVSSSRQTGHFICPIVVPRLLSCWGKRPREQRDACPSRRYRSHSAVDGLDTGSGKPDGLTGLNLHAAVHPDEHIDETVAVYIAAVGVGNRPQRVAWLGNVDRRGDGLSRSS